MLLQVMPRPDSSQLSSSATSGVEMEGGIGQQRAWRKRPPEDHAEWKRQKNSDSAGQHLSPIVAAWVVKSKAATVHKFWITHSCLIWKRITHCLF